MTNHPTRTRLRAQRGRPRAAFRPTLEKLEDRLAPAIYIVTGLADGAGAVKPSVTAGIFLASTLRAAIGGVDASTSGANNTIDLGVAGTYPITLVGTAGEIDNAAGEFAIIPNGTNGSSLTIQNTSAGAVTVDANHLNRVFDINPADAVTTPKFSVSMTGFTITNGEATPGDMAPGSGGGIRDQGNVSLTLTNVTLSNSLATADGGGVSMENGASTPWTLTLNNCTVTGNHAGDAGGGVETDGSGKVFVNGGTISNNTCVNQGAGIWLDAILASNGTVGSATVTMGNNVTMGGTAYTTAPTVTINDPTGTGATGFATIANGSVIDVAITNVGTGYTAPTISFSGGGGTGAMATANLAVLQSANLTVTGALITNNKALSTTTGVGGGIGNAGDGAVTIVNSTISNNTAGGVGGGFSDQNNVGVLVVVDSYFLANVAAGNGGGIQEGGPLTSISNTQIQGNSTGGVGGGLFVAGNTLFLQSSTIAGNTSASNGGGIELATFGTGINVSTITDSTITGNLALNNVDVNGGGIDMEGIGDLELKNDTINANFAGNGGGIFWPGAPGVFTLRNTIVAANTIAGDGTGPDADDPAGTFADQGGNLIGVSGAGGGNTGFTAGTTQTGTVATPLGPLLAALQNNGGPVVGATGTSLVLQTEPLLIGSPAFGTGTLARALSVDERGLPSVVNGKINIGASSNVPSVSPPGISMRQISLGSKVGNTTTINVNTTADGLFAFANANTLRDAIQLANSTAGNVIINLTVPGTYKITLVGTPGETDNAAGEFALYQGGATNPTTVTIQNVSGGAVTIDGNHLNRVFDINPNNVTTTPKFSVTMTGITITNGEATPMDMAPGSGGGIRDEGNVSLTLTNVTLSNNLATADGGGVSMENFPASTKWKLTLNNCTVIDNHAGDAGGGVETDGAGEVFVNGGIVSNNTCVNQGAGIWLDATMDGVASVTINNPGVGYTTPPTVTFSAPQTAGGTTATGTATITGGVVTAVTIANPGSGYTPTTVPTVTFSAPPAGITATGTANLGFNVSAQLTVNGTLVKGNAALSAMMGNDGGIGNAGNGAVAITGSTIENNFAAVIGGGFGDFNSVGTLTVANSLFLNNVAVAAGGGIQEAGPTTSITTTQVQGNVTGGLGGGLNVAGTTLTLLRSTIAGNVSAAGGGGIEVVTAGTIGGANPSTITASTIAGNLALNNADVNGGGIDAEEAGDLTLLNNTINANFGGNGGGVFWAGTGVFGVKNTIVAANTIAGDGTGPDVDNPAGTITDNGGNVIGISGALSGNIGFTGASQTGTLAVPLNPLLGPLTNNGGPTIGAPGTTIVLQTELLQSGSPAVARGIVFGAPPIDERGAPFNVGGTVNAGATSYRPAVVVQHRRSG